jgi:MFS family permease
VAAIAAIAVFYIINSHHVPGLFAAFVFGGCAFSIYSLSMAHANDNVEATNVLEISRGLLLLSGIGAAIGPLSAGLLMSWFGSQALMIYFSVLMLLLAGLSLVRRTIGSSISISEQGDFVIMARSSPAVLELDPRAETVKE